MGFLKKVGKLVKKAAKGVSKLANNKLVGTALNFIPGGNVAKMVSAVVSSGAVDKSKVKSTLAKNGQKTDAGTVNKVAASLQANASLRGVNVPVVESMNANVDAPSNTTSNSGKFMDKVKEFYNNHKTLVWVLGGVLVVVTGGVIYFAKKHRR